MFQGDAWFLCLLTILAAPPIASQETRPLLAITHVKVVPMDRERVLTDQTVLNRLRRGMQPIQNAKDMPTKTKESRQR